MQTVVNMSQQEVASVTMPLEVLPPGEYLLRSDAEWAKNLVKTYNEAYRLGYRCMMTLILVVYLLLAPFLGFGSAMWQFMISIARQVSGVIGHTLSDAYGYGETVRTLTMYAAWKRKQHAGHVTMHCPPNGYGGTMRFPAIYEEEVGIAQDGAPGCWARPVQAYNWLFAHGFFAGTIVLTVATFIAAPFIGMYVAMASVFLAVFRPLLRATGRLILDLYGVGELAAQVNAYLREEMGMVDDLQQGSRDMQPRYGTNAPPPPSGPVLLLHGNAGAPPSGPIVVQTWPASAAAPSNAASQMRAAAPVAPPVTHTATAPPLAPMYPPSAYSEDPGAPAGAYYPSLK